MEVKFDVIKPNLYVVGDAIYFSMDNSDFIQATSSIDEVISKHIGILKIKESDKHVLLDGKSKPSEVYTLPLKEYLGLLKMSLSDETGITYKDADLFGLGYIVDAQTIENSADMNSWRELKIDLVKPNEIFDKYEEEHGVFRIDREKTLDGMKKLYEELDQKMPDNYAEFYLVNGTIRSSNENFKIQHIGRVLFLQLKAENKNKIEEAKTDLIKKLKEIEGPCLSYDAPVLFNQMFRLYAKSQVLIQNYGDILKQPNWKTRFFRLDP